MAKSVLHTLLHLCFFFFFSFFFFSIYGSGQPESPYSQFQALLQIQQLLNYPPGLSSLNEATDFCNTQPSQSLTVVCYGENLTQLHINGESWFHPMAQNFSSESLFSALSTIPSLKVLSLVSLGLWGPLPPSIARLSSLEILNISSNHFNGRIPEEISTLRTLQTLVLDHNMFTGEVPGWLGELQLTVLSLRNNSLTGSLPYSLTKMQTLRVLQLSMSQLSGEVPDLRNLTNLQVLDLGHNKLGPHFPSLHTRLLTLVLRDNSFGFGIPPELSSYYQLQTLDISLNKFVGPFLLPLLSLPSLSYLDVSGNKFTGMLSANTSCNAKLAFVNLSSNHLTGELPSCLNPSSNTRVIKYAGNCLSHSGEEQHPYSFCHNEALAVNIMPRKQDRKSSRRGVVIVSSLMGGILGGIAVCGLIFLAATKLYSRQTVKAPPARLILEKVTPANTIKMLSDARYISETRKLGALGIPPYRTFTLDELKEATSNFNASNLIGEGSWNKVYRGMLTDGTLVAIRSLKMRKRHGIQYYRQQIESLSKLRHRHLVSAVGHCFECYPDDSGVITIFLVFEFVPNGTLRGCISEGLSGLKFTWTRRISAAIGVARGLQFLHTGIVPGLYSNNLKITDILLDHDLYAKISNYNLPLLAEERRMEGDGASSSEPKEPNRVITHGDKNDVYDMGVILLEIIVGRAIMSQSAAGVAKDLLQVSLATDEAGRRSIVDPAVHKECSDDSLKTVMEICVRCLSQDPADRPSVEDVIWNLQFAAQVQDSWKADSKSSNHGSPIMSPQ